MTDHGVDYYAVLEISPDASTAQIRRAYRRRLRRVHPDTRPADDPPSAEPVRAGAALALLREAFAVLGDPARRAAYDRRTRPTQPRPRPATPTAAPAHESCPVGPPDPPLRAGPVRYRPSPSAGGDR